jgi:hypothetical protein
MTMNGRVDGAPHAAMLQAMTAFRFSCQGEALRVEQDKPRDGD